jgi:hypothetical protein
MNKQALAKYFLDENLGKSGILLLSEKKNKCLNNLHSVQKGSVLKF